MNDEQRVEYIQHYQDRISILKSEIRDCEKQIEGHKANLQKVYYLEMTGRNGYEKGVIFAGSYEDVCQYVDIVLVYEVRDKHGSQVYPKKQADGNKNPIGTQWYNSGLIRRCTPLDDNWHAVYELSLKVKS